MLASRFSRGGLALITASALLIPGFLLFADAPIHLVGIDGEETWGFLFISFPAFVLGLIGVTLALLNRSRFHPFGIEEE